MPCPDCQDHATEAEILELIQRHHQRMQAEFDQQLQEVVSEFRRTLETLNTPTTRPPGVTLH